MKIVETLITDTVVRIRLADDADPLKAKSRIECHLARDDLKRQSGAAVDFENWHLPAAHQAILEIARAALDAEKSRLKLP